MKYNYEMLLNFIFENEFHTNRPLYKVFYKWDKQKGWIDRDNNYALAA